MMIMQNLLCKNVIDYGCRYSKPQRFQSMAHCVLNLLQVKVNDQTMLEKVELYKGHEVILFFGFVSSVSGQPPSSVNR